MGVAPKKETARHIQAFEYFYWLGDGRTQRQVAQQFKTTDQSVAMWSKTFKWDERIQDRERRAAQAVQDKGDAEAIKIRENQIAIGKAVVQRFSARLGTQAQRDELSAKGYHVSEYEPSAMDAAKWASLLLLLTGQATSRSEVNLSQGTLDALVAGIVTILRKHLPADLRDKVADEIAEYAKSLTQAQQKPMAGAPAGTA